MIDEIKKEVEDKTFSCLTINNERHGQNAKAIFLEDVLEIIDRYNSKSNEEEYTFEMEYINQMQKEINYLENYEKAWEELKEDCREVEKANDYILYERLQQLEQKYGIGE